jgi:hypothetical protein
LAKRTGGQDLAKAIESAMAEHGSAS